MIHPGRSKALILALASLLTGSAVRVIQAASPATPDQIAGLIRELGSDRFATREAASDKLAQIGLPAFAALEEALRHADRETRFRAERVLTLIRKNDLERRLAAFAAGTAEDDYDLPAWKRFSKSYGDTELTRRLFVEMQRADAELLAALDRDPRSAVDVLGRRLQERSAVTVRGVTTTDNGTSTGEISAYLFVAAQEDAPVSMSTLAGLMQMCRERSLVESLRTPKGSDAPKKMLGAAIGRCEAEAALNAMYLAIDLELKEGLTPALKSIERGGRNQALHPALLCVLNLGDATHVPAVETLLTNETSLGQFARGTARKDFQVRDAALATLILLTKQDPKDYYDNPGPLRNPASPLGPIQAEIAGFESTEEGKKKREAAIAKWMACKERQKIAAGGGDGAAPALNKPAQ